MATVTFIKYQKQSAGSLRGVAGYVSQAQKTRDEDGDWLVSGQNCTPQLAAQEFMATRQMHHKDSPVWFYHYVQSFHPQELVTGKEAHQLAQNFARQAWPDSEVLIATHTDRKTRRRQREKIIALGQKADDHEDKPTWEPSM